MRTRMLNTLLRLAAGLLVAGALAGCFSSDEPSGETETMASTAREITEGVINTAMTSVTGKMGALGDAWSLPTPTALPEDATIPFFDKQAESVPATAIEGGYWWVVAVDILNVRAGPSSDQPTIATFAAGDCLLSDAQEGGWLKLSMPDQRQGWLAGEEVQLATGCASGRVRSVWDGITGVAAATPAAPSVTGKGMITVPQLNVRNGPGTDAEIVSTLAAYDCVDLVKAEGEWYEVALPTSGQGWAFGEYVKPVEDCTEAKGLQATVVAAAAAAVIPVAAVAASTPVPEVAASAAPAVALVSPNAAVTTGSQLHECFGGGSSPLRDVSAGTPVQVLGTGPFWPPAEEQNALGTGPFLKIKLWDGQTAWIPAAAVGFDLTTAAALSGQCEDSDRLNWDNVVRPTATLVPRITPVSNQSNQGGWVQTTPGIYTNARNNNNSNYNYSEPTPTPTRTPTPRPTDEGRERDSE